LIRLLLKFF